MILIKDGDHRAFTLLYDRYASRIKAFFYRMLWSDSSVAEDHLHDLFAKLIERPELYNEHSLVRPWLFQIAHNMCKNAYRKKGFETQYLSQLEEGVVYSEAERSIDEGFIKDEVYKLLDMLDEERRSMFLLRYQQDMSLRELAEIYDIPSGTVKSKLFYIRKFVVDRVELD